MDNPITLDEDEINFITSKNTHKNKLAFAVMLKYFQNTGRYPVAKNSISLDLINSLANQLNISASLLNQFDWTGRTAERFRHAIRHYLGFRKATRHDSKLLKAWLIENSLPEAPSIKQSITQAYHYLYAQKIEPFTEKELERHVRSATQAYEQQLFSSIYQQLSVTTLNTIDTLLIEIQEAKEDALYEVNGQIQFRHLKKEMSGARLKHVKFEIQKLNCIKHLAIPDQLFKKLSRKLIKKYHDRIIAEPPSDVLRHPYQQKYAMVALFLYYCSQRIIDDLADLFIQLIHKMKTSAESFINKKIVSEVKHVNGKFDILYSLAKTSLSHPEGIIREKIYPAVGKEMLSDLIQEMNYKGKWYQSQVQFKIQSLYSYSHRKALLNLLAIFTFQANTVDEQNFLQAIELIKTYRDELFKYFPVSVKVPLKNIIASEWQSNIIENQEGVIKVNRMAYEIALLEALRRKLRCKNIWITGAYHYRNPDEDLPQDFDVNREAYFKKLDLPLDAKAFTAPLKTELHQQLQALNDTLPNNDKVKIVSKHPGRIKLSPSVAQNEPINLEKLHQQIQRRWPSINLIDILKEVDLQIGFTNQFYTVASRENIPQETLQKRLLLCLYGIGSNMGLKRVSAANDDVNYSDLRYVKRRFINVANVRAAIAEVINKILEIRDPVIWGDATTGCACDSTKVSAWDQNLLTEWHTRYKGRGVMIYWHVDRKAACIYSQLKTCSSSEVGSMIKGILRHCTKMDMDQLYVDTHGQSTLGFAVSYLLHFDLLPRLKNLHQQKLYYS